MDDPMIPTGRLPSLQPSARPAAFPERPALRPGVRVVRRDHDRLQVGLLPGERLLLPDDPAVRALLDAVAAGERPDLGSDRVRGWALALLEHGLVVDRDEVAGLMSSGLPRPVVHAALAQSGTGARERLAGRASATVGLEADGPWREETLALLAEAGLRCVQRGGPATVRLLVSPGGELPRPSLDGLMRSGAAHLVVSNVAGRVRVGPLVAPGLSACVRCVDAHAADRDPGHGLVLEQHGPGADEPCDPLLMRLALALAVRDLASYVEGGLPATWSATVAVEPDLRLEREEWTRHPRCGCAWGEGLASA